MLQDLLLITALAYITYCGALCAKNILRLDGSYSAAALGLPLGLSVFSLLTLTLSHFFSLPISAVISLLLLRLLNIKQDWLHYIKHEEQDDLPLETPEAFGRFTLTALAAFALAMLALLHLLQLNSLPPGFLTDYPFTRSLLKGSVILDAPFYPNCPYTGSLYQAFVAASLSLTLNGDVLRTAWISQSIFLLDAVFLWTLSLRLFLNRALPAALGGALLFSLFAAAACSNSLLRCSDILNAAVCGALVLAYTHIMRQGKNHLRISALAAALYGALTCFAWGLSPAGSAVLFSAFAAATAASSLQRRFLAKILWRAFFMVFAAAIIWSGTQTDYWRQLRLCHAQGLILPQIPSRHFLEIYLPLSEEAAAYVSLFSRTAMRQHAPAFWMAPLLLIWSVRRKSRKGIFLWCGGTLLFFLPGIIGFQTRGNTPPWLWEIASDGVFAILLGFAAGDIYQLWARHRTSQSAIMQRTALSAALLAAISPLLLNTAAVWHNSHRLRRHVNYLCNPLYPPVRQWLADIPQLALSERERETAAALWRANDRPYRVFFALSDLEVQTPGHIALLAGQAGCLPVGSSSNVMLENPPYNMILPAPGALVFLQQQKTEALLSLGTELLVSSQPVPLEQIPQHALRQRPLSYSGSEKDAALCAYKIDGSFPWKTPVIPCPVPEISVSIKNMPETHQLASGVVYKVTAQFNRSLRGWLTPLWYDKQNRRLSQEPPLCAYIDGDCQEIPLVMPYKEGSYLLSWLFYPTDRQGACAAPSGGEALKVWRLAGSTAIEQHYSANLENSLRLVKVRHNSQQSGTVVLTNIAQHSLDLGSDLRLRWKIWSPENHSYVYSDKAENTVLPLPLSPGATVELPWNTAYLPRNNERPEFNISTPFGAPQTLTRK